MQIDERTLKMYSKRINVSLIEGMAEITDTKAEFMNGKTYIYRNGTLLAGGLTRREALNTLNAIYEYDRQKDEERKKEAKIRVTNEFIKSEFVKAMHTIVCRLNDEGFYFDKWRNIMPDCPTEEDFMDIAEEGSEVIFEELTSLFEYIMTEACKEEKPFYIGDKCV